VATKAEVVLHQEEMAAQQVTGMEKTLVRQLARREGTLWVAPVEAILRAGLTGALMAGQQQVREKSTPRSWARRSWRKCALPPRTTARA
jgi:hypothetical protein